MTIEKSGKIAVIGDKDVTLAFKAAGAEVFSASNAFEANDTLKALCKGDYAVIFITENIAELIPEVLEKLKTKPFPAVIPIPGAGKSSGFCMNGLKKDVEKAIGADILFNK